MLEPDDKVSCFELVWANTHLDHNVSGIVKLRSICMLDDGLPNFFTFFVMFPY